MFTTLLPLIFASLALARPHPIKRQDSAPVALYPYYANQAAANLTTHQYSEVYVTPQYYAEPSSDMSWTPEDRFTTIMIQSVSGSKGHDVEVAIELISQPPHSLTQTDDSTTSGYLVYG